MPGRRPTSRARWASELLAEPGVHTEVADRPWLLVRGPGPGPPLPSCWRLGWRASRSLGAP
eukprot:5028550-Pyramimonas_sp.AAC.1